MILQRLYFLIVAILLMTNLAIAADKKPLTCPQALGQATNTSQQNNTADTQTVENLLSFFNSLTPENKTLLFKSLKDVDFNKALSSLKANEENPRINEVLKLDQMNTNILMDVIQLGLVFPMIFSKDNSEQMVPSLLQTIKSSPNLTKGNSIFGENQVNANALNTTIWQSITGVIRNGIEDYNGTITNVEDKDIGYWSNVWRKVRRFWQTHYSRVTKVIIPFAVDLQKMLSREISLDEVIIEKAFSQKLNISEETKAELIDKFLNDTGDAIKHVEGLAKSSFGKEFMINQPTFAHETDLINTADRIKKLNQSAISKDQDQSLLKSLDETNQRINEDLAKQGKAQLTIQDALKNELKLYYGILNRYIPRKRDDYFNQTSVKTGDTYTYTDKVRHESVTRDKDGRVTSRRVWYTYSTTTVNPTFEMTLSGSYPTGNYSNGRLSSVKSAAKSFVEVERPMRVKTSRAESIAMEFEEGFLNISQETGAGRQALEIKIQEQYDIVVDQIGNLQNYMRKRPLLYKFDNEKTFNGRNKELLNRMINVKRLLEVELEILRRPDIKNPYITFKVWNDYHWLVFLKSHHKKNITIKIALALKGLTASAAGFGAFKYHNDYYFMQSVNENAPILADLFKLLGGG